MTENYANRFWWYRSDACATIFQSSLSSLSSLKFYFDVCLKLDLYLSRRTSNKCNIYIYLLIVKPITINIELRFFELSKNKTETQIFISSDRKEILLIWHVTKYLIVTRQRWVNYYTNFDLFRRHRVIDKIQTARYSKKQIYIYVFSEEQTKKVEYFL